MRCNRILSVAVFLLFLISTGLSNTVSASSERTFGNGMRSLDVAVTPLDNHTIVIAYINASSGDLFFKVYDTNGNLMTGPVTVDHLDTSRSRVSLSPIDSNKFVIGWIDGSDRDVRSAVYNKDGSAETSTITVDDNVGSRPDVSVAEIGNGDRFVVCYANDDDNDADYKIYSNDGTQLVGERPVDYYMNPDKTLQNYVSCNGIDANRWLYAWYDDGSDDASYAEESNSGATYRNGDVDTNIGNDGQVASTVLNSTTYVIAWYDSLDRDITITVRDTSGSTVVSPKDIDTNAGNRARISVSAAKTRDGNTVFVVAWYDKDEDAIMAGVYYPDGTEYTAPFTVEDDPYQEGLLSVAGYYHLTGVSLCPGTFVIAYTNSTPSSNYKLYYVNGSSWDGVCDLTPPTISLVPPTDPDGSMVPRNWTFINVTLDESGSCVLEWDGSNITMDGSDTNWYLNKTDVDGDHVFTVYCVDTHGNLANSAQRHITFDSVAPSIDFVSPTTASGNYAQDWVSANVTASDTHLSSVTIYLYGSSVEHHTCSSSPCYHNFTGLSDGAYYLNATAQDQAGNLNRTETRTILLDTHPPQVSFVPPTPVNDSKTNRDWVVLNISITEAFVDKVLLNWSGSVTQYDVGDLSGSSPNYWLSVNKSGLSDGSYDYFFVVNDTFGNTNSTEVRRINVDTTPPSWTDVANITVTYGDPVHYDFNATDASGIDRYWINDTTHFYINGTTGELVNRTALATGVYPLNLSVNDTYNNIASVPVYVNITKAPTILTLSVSPSWEVTYPTTTNVSCTANNDEVSVTLYRNGTAVSNPDVGTLDPNVYNYTCNASGSQNYTSAQTSALLTVNRRTSSSSSSKRKPRLEAVANISCRDTFAEVLFYVSSEGDPVSNARVSVSRVVGSYKYLLTANYTDANGYVMFELGNGVYSAYVRKDRYKSYEFQVTVNCSYVPHNQTMNETYNETVETSNQTNLSVSCTADSDCGYDEFCDNGTCKKLECICGYIDNHRCVHYECCYDVDCGAGMVCVDHSCQPTEGANESVHEEFPDVQDRSNTSHPTEYRHEGVQNRSAQGSERVIFIGRRYLTIQDPTGIPASDVMVYLIDEDGKTYGPFRPDKNGQIEIPLEAKKVVFGSYLTNASNVSFETRHLCMFYGHDYGSMFGVCWYWYIGGTLLVLAVISLNIVYSRLFKH